MTDDPRIEAAARALWPMDNSAWGWEELPESLRIRYRDKATAALRAADAAAWRGIESAPKDGTRVLLWHDTWVAPNSGQYYGEISGWRVDASLRWRYQPTHWQPLPSFPTTQEPT